MSSSEVIFAFTERMLFRKFPRIYYHLYHVYKAVSDKKERFFASQHIKPGMTVVDVGANIGVYTSFFASLVGERGKVHAFEPDPVNSDMHEKFVRLGNAVLVRKAVDQTSRELILYTSPSLNVDHRTYDAGDGRQEICIQSVSLDDYFSPGSPVDFIKLDIQGYEYYALLGAERVLTENKSVRLMFEYDPKALECSGGGPEILLGYLKKLGFNVYRDSSHGLIKVSNFCELGDVVSYTNLYAMR